MSQPFDVEFDGYVAENVTLRLEGPATVTFTHRAPFRHGSTFALAGGGAVFSKQSASLVGASLVLLGGSLGLPAGTVFVDRLYCDDGSGGIRPAPKGRYSSTSVPGAEWEFLRPLLDGVTMFVRRGDAPSTGLHVFFMLED